MKEAMWSNISVGKVERRWDDDDWFGVALDSVSLMSCVVVDGEWRIFCFGQEGFPITRHRRSKALFIKNVPTMKLASFVAS